MALSLAKRQASDDSLKQHTPSSPARMHLAHQLAVGAPASPTESPISAGIKVETAVHSPKLDDASSIVVTESNYGDPTKAEEHLKHSPSSLVTAETTAAVNWTINDEESTSRKKRQRLFGIVVTGYFVSCHHFGGHSAVRGSLFTSTSCDSSRDRIIR